MLRPRVIITVSKKSNFKEMLDFYQETGKYYDAYIKPISIEVTETRKGIDLKFTTKHNKYDIVAGDYIFCRAFYSYVDESWSRLPVMVVREVNINSDYTMEITCSDEFRYICETTSMQPYNPSKEQKKFLANKFLVSDYKNEYTPPEKRPDLNLKEMLGYIQSVVGPKLFYYKDILTDADVEYKEDVLFAKNGKDLNSNLGKFELGIRPTVSQILDLLNQHFYIDFFSTSFSINELPTTIDGYYANQILVIDLASCMPDENPPFKFNFYDNWNIVENNLIFKNAATNGKGIKGVFKTKKTKTEPATEVIYYAYFDTDGKVKTTDNIELIGNTGNKINYYDTLTINDSSTISTDEKLNLIKQKLLATTYTGYVGSIKTFNFGLNVFDRVYLYFNNLAKNEGVISDGETVSYAIKQITRTYDNSGLWMTIELRQQLTLKDGLWKNTNES